MGMRTKPAASEPSAAPAVLAPYSRPAGPPGRVGEATTTRTAIGNVAPSATAGTSRTANEHAILTIEKTEPVPSSPYAQANTGPSSVRPFAIDERR